MGTSDIRKAINIIEGDEDFMVTYSVLVGNFWALTTSEYTRLEAIRLVYSVSDALSVGEVSESTRLWLDIKSIQHDMIEQLSVKS